MAGPRIYTRTGDAGETSLGDGSRVPKAGPRIEAIGAIDEANAAIGMARLAAEPALDAMLARIQNELFDLGAELALAAKPGEARIAPDMAARLEREIDTMSAALPALRHFVLPGGSKAAAHLHLARAIARRAERRMVELARAGTLHAPALAYVNRLSDHLFMAARFANRAQGDVKWVPSTKID